jgi:hypothetical protein
MGVVGLWLAAAVGVTAVWVGTHDAGQQRDVMRGQLDEMQADQRPWIPPRLLIPSDIIIYRDERNAIEQITIPLRFVFDNIGRTPALFLTVAVFGTNAKFSSTLASAQREGCDKHTSVGNGVSVFPKQHVDSDIYFVDLINHTRAQVPIKPIGQAIIGAGDIIRSIKNGETLKVWTPYSMGASFTRSRQEIVRGDPALPTDWFPRIQNRRAALPQYLSS